MANPGALAIASPALLVLAVGLWLATRLVGRPAPATRPAVDPTSHREVLQRYRAPAVAAAASLPTPVAPPRLVSIPAGGDAPSHPTTTPPGRDEPFEADRREVA